MHCPALSASSHCQPATAFAIRAANSSGVGGHTHRFRSVKDWMARASPARSGDTLAGIAAKDDEERVVAQMALAEMPLRTFLSEALIPYEQDEVTRLIIGGHDAAAFTPV